MCQGARRQIALGNIVALEDCNMSLWEQLSRGVVWSCSLESLVMLSLPGNWSYRASRKSSRTTKQGAHLITH
jgi:hypothetical protein